MIDLTDVETPLLTATTHVLLMSRAWAPALAALDALTQRRDITTRLDGAYEYPTGEMRNMIADRVELVNARASSAAAEPLAMDCMTELQALSRAATSLVQYDAAIGADESMRRACGIARGEISVPVEPCGDAIFAQKDYNSRGSCREHWYRMRWDGMRWVYGGERLPVGTKLAADRRATRRSAVYEGDLLISHDLGKDVDPGARLVVVDDSPLRRRLVECPIVKLADGHLRIQLPDGSHIDRLDRLNPRKR